MAPCFARALGLTRLLLRAFACVGMAVALHACAWQPGVPFATVSVRLEARWQPSASLEGSADGWQTLDDGYEVRVEEAHLGLGGLELIDERGGSFEAFDESRPPAGYSLCHGGHCHSDEGDLVPYEELDERGPRAVLTFAGVEVDLLAAPAAAAPLKCVGREVCELPLAEVQRLRVEIEHLDLRGVIRGGPDSSSSSSLSPTPFRLELAAGAEHAPVVLSAGLHLDTGRGLPPEVTLEVRLQLSPELLEHLPWDTLPVLSEGIEVHASEEALEHVEEHLAEVPIMVELTRSWSAR